MICTQCNREIPDGSTVCLYCGSAIKAARPSSGAPEPAGSGSSSFKKAGDFSPPAPPSSGVPSSAVRMTVRPTEKLSDAGWPAPPPPPAAAGRFCLHCGAKLTGAVKFCPSCGAKTEASSGGGYGAPTGGSGTPATGYTPPVPSASASSFAARPAYGARATLREICLSSVSLVVVILYSLSILLTIISTVSMSNSIASMITNLSWRMGGGSDVGELLNMMDRAVSGASAAAAIFANIPTILIAIGLWMFYLSAKNGEMKTSGLTVIRVITLISFVSFCLVIGLAEVFIFVLAMQSSSSGIEYFLLIMFIIALVAFPSGFFVFQELRTVDTVRNIVLTGEPSDRFSRYVAVMLYIGAGFQIIGALISCFAGGGFFTLLSGLCSGSVSILFGIIIFTLRTRMQELMG